MLAANSTLGLVRGLQTFTQLVYTLPPQGARYIPSVPISIRDFPAFPHRAFMLDTSRAFFPVTGERDVQASYLELSSSPSGADITRTLDAMSWAKLNVLHW